MRLFAALPLPPPVRASLQAALPPLPPGLRYTAAERWHVTLAFYGEVAPGVVPELDVRLARAAARAHPLSLALSGGGHFGRAVLWCGIAGDVPALVRLAERAVAAGRRVGITGGTGDTRAYRPHVTLLRARRGADLRPLSAALAGYSGPAWTAAELVLVRSHLGAEARHEVLTRHPLGQSRSTM